MDKSPRYMNVDTDQEITTVKGDFKEILRQAYIAGQSEVELDWHIQEFCKGDCCGHTKLAYSSFEEWFDLNYKLKN